MKKILVAEDEKEVRNSIIDLLELNGYTVIPAIDGQQAIDYLEKEIPDLVISDIMMPKVDGYKVLEHFQKVPNAANVPFIFLTAKAEMSDLRKGMIGGANDYITKPFRAAELIKTVEVHLKKKDKVEQKLNEILFDISHSIPHEFRTPLIPILGFSELLKEDFDELSKEEILEFIDKINNSGQKLYKTIEKFVRYSDINLRIAQKNNSTQNKNYPGINTSEFIKSISERITIEYERFEDLILELKEAEVKIFKGDFQFIIEELLLNAVKFSEKGTSINIKSYIKYDQYLLEVSDNGIGIPQKQLNNIKPFLQHNKNELQQEGNGLGLITVKMLTEYYNGNFILESIVSEYTKCTISIPLN